MGNVVLAKPVTLRPGIRVAVRFIEDGLEDEAPISDIAELRHIR